MTASTPADPAAPWLRGAFHELPDAECLALLAAVPVGRVAFWGDAGPTVLPVNHVADEGGLRFRTSPYSSVAALRTGTVVAFEADETDPVTRSGWSVLVRGTIEVVVGPGARDDGPEPWPHGVRSVLVRVHPTQVTGRRVLGA